MREAGGRIERRRKRVVKMIAALWSENMTLWDTKLYFIDVVEMEGHLSIQYQDVYSVIVKNIIFGAINYK